MHCTIVRFSNAEARQWEFIVMLLTTIRFARRHSGGTSGGVWGL